MHVSPIYAYIPYVDTHKHTYTHKQAHHVYIKLCIYTLGLHTTLVSEVSAQWLFQVATKKLSLPCATDMAVSLRHSHDIAKEDIQITPLRFVELLMTDLNQAHNHNYENTASNESDNRNDNGSSDDSGSSISSSNNNGSSNSTSSSNSSSSIGGQSIWTMFNSYKILYPPDRKHYRRVLDSLAS